MANAVSAAVTYDDYNKKFVVVPHYNEPGSFPGYYTDGEFLGDVLTGLLVADLPPAREKEPATAGEGAPPKAPKKASGKVVEGD